MKAIPFLETSLIGLLDYPTRLDIEDMRGLTKIKSAMEIIYTTLK